MSYYRGTINPPWYLIMGPGFYPLSPADAEDSPVPAYALSGKIPLTIKIILSVTVISCFVVVCFHLYLDFASRRRRLRRFGFQTQPAVTSTRRLNANVPNCLRVFLYSSKTHRESTPVCSVCLSEFEENEKGRTLPKCGHTFHIECIDMWFQSHSTCPLCRPDVEPGPVSETPDEVVLAVSEPERIDAGSSSNLCSDCEHEDEQLGQPSSSIAARRKPMELVGVSIEVPRRNERFWVESNSLASQRGFKSPTSANFSSATVSPTSANAASFRSPDIEQGAVDDSRQTQV